MASSAYYYVTGAAGNQKTLTLSGWFKVCKQVSGGCFFSYHYSSTNARSEVFINASSQLLVGICPDGSTWKELTYPMKIRDPSAWYHLVVAYDTTQATEADRVKVYINGNQQTASSGTYPSLNEDTGWNANGYQHTIGRYESGDASYVDGCVTHVNFIDGTAYAPTAFGEFDSTSGIWVAKTSPSVTYGDEGGFWKFASGALTTDSSGNSNTLTSVGTPTETKDTPDNNFSTFNPLCKGDNAYSNGNLTAQTDSSNWHSAVSSLCVGAGKWYVEYKWNTTGGTNFGIADARSINLFGQGEMGYNPTNAVGDSVGWYGGGSDVKKNGSFYYSADTYSAGDIISVALDCDNGAVYFRKNGGSWQNSGDPTSGATRTGAVPITTGETYFFGGTTYTNGCNISANFGNGYFGTTSVGATNADDAGEGVFKYDVPDGYYALCTNNIATYG